MAISDVMNQQPAQAPTEQPAAGGTQEDYERVVVAGLQFLSDEGSHRELMNMLAQGAENPPRALADTTHVIMTQIQEQAQGQIPEDVILPATEEILENVAEFAHESGAFQVDDQVMGQASQMVVRKMAETAQGGDMSQEEVQGMLGQIEQSTMDQIVQE